MADDVLINKAATIERCVARLLLPITVRIITQHLDEFLDFSKAVLQRSR